MSGLCAQLCSLRIRIMCNAMKRTRSITTTAMTPRRQSASPRMRAFQASVIGSATFPHADPPVCTFPLPPGGEDNIVVPRALTLNHGHPDVADNPIKLSRAEQVIESRKHPPV